MDHATADRLKEVREERAERPTRRTIMAKKTPTPKLDPIALACSHEAVPFGKYVSVRINSRSTASSTDKWEVRVFSKCVECPVLGNSFSRFHDAVREAKRLQGAIEVLSEYPEIAQAIGKHGH